MKRSQATEEKTLQEENVSSQVTTITCITPSWSSEWNSYQRFTKPNEALFGKREQNDLN